MDFRNDLVFVLRDLPIVIIMKFSIQIVLDQNSLACADFLSVFL